MEYFPPALENLVEHFAKLPGIGRKTAQRLAFYVLSLPQEEADFLQAFLGAQYYRENKVVPGARPGRRRTVWRILPWRFLRLLSLPCPSPFCC